MKWWTLALALAGCLDSAAVRVPIAVDVPLTDDELDELEERGLDVHYALGVIHAVGVAPGMIPTPQWLPLAFGNVPPDQSCPLISRRSGSWFACTTRSSACSPRVARS